MIWRSALDKNPGKILLMLSGGKDSVYCLALLKSLNYDVTCVYFSHEWSWKNSFEEVSRACKTFQAELIKFDISDDFKKMIENSVCGRPCRFCKPIMYKIAIDYAVKNNFHYICVGDNSSDTIIVRLESYLRSNDFRNKDLSVNGYLDCVEQGISVPESIVILRPIIDISANQVEKNLLKDFDYKVKKHFETGDKYYGYWREGCPIQYTDPGFKHTHDSLDFLHRINEVATEYGKKHQFRVSIHYPSLHIVTVPSGHEEEIFRYLTFKGFTLNPRPKTKKKPYIEHWIIQVFDVPAYYLEKFDVLDSLANRFIERSKLNVVDALHKQFKPFGVSIVKLLEESHIMFHSWPEDNFLYIDLVSCQKLNFTKESFKILTSEVFKTTNIIVKKYESKENK